ncbi:MULTISPECIES: DUF992 domain-containing protein [Alphaproteobacteria]|uniref:DUF992 domain-containing protein n=2 Tax=Alphaproteobacteria TaxID=28211 RepID=A0A512HCS2_9HYPH|nr:MULTISPECIES: DUF992 domain-containing protein [Alphaproteobacteria]GEO83248.1 hypothetical protein RNA01_01800 [Ciceribacter naphthalenivorans]GLR20357.1 hypothetical protein GCM10007920_01410 [Ciceribacter naphthalenivorans]GLT03213.1 hypothetical protein GCM10007926_01410 [Sphingomonas psychrolutea]
MNKTITMAIAALPVLLSAGMAVSADVVTAREPVPVYQETDRVDGVKIGYLTCDVAGGVGYVLGSAKQAECVFSSVMGGEAQDRYSGTIRKMGVDVGFTTRSKLVWAVFAPTAGYHQGSLGGLYQGASVEATVGAGVGANVLVGGTSGSIQLQTVSVTGQLGLNLAATGTSVTLTPEK